MSVRHSPNDHGPLSTAYHAALCGDKDCPPECVGYLTADEVAFHTAHLAAVLADPETVEAVARALYVDHWGDEYPSDEADCCARAAIAVIAERLGVQA